MQKYGEGRIVEKQCPECHETFELRKAGTHIGDNNSIAVFCDDDPIVCPYCDYTEQGTILQATTLTLQQHYSWVSRDVINFTGGQLQIDTQSLEGSNFSLMC